MAIWLWHGIAVYGYLALWLHDCIAIELDGYVAIQLCHGMAVYGYMTITCNAAISACRIGREWPITCNAVASAREKGGERYNHIHSPHCCDIKLAETRVTRAILEPLGVIGRGRLMFWASWHGAASR